MEASNPPVGSIKEREQQTPDDSFMVTNWMCWMGINGHRLRIPGQIHHLSIAVSINRHCYSFESVSVDKKTVLILLQLLSHYFLEPQLVPLPPLGHYWR